MHACSACHFKMAASFAWLSIIAKRGLKIEQKSKIVQCNWKDSFGELLQKANERFQTSTVEKVVVSKNDRFIDVQEERHRFTCVNL